MTYQYAIIIDLAINGVDHFIETLARTSNTSLVSMRVAKLQKRLASLFRAQGSALIKALPALTQYFIEASLASKFDTVFEEATADTSIAMMQALEKASSDALLLAAQTAISAFNVQINFTLDNPRAIQYLQDYGVEKITQIDEATKADIRKLLDAAIQNGVSYSAVAQQIKKRYTEFAEGKPQIHIQSRATLIAVTEIGNAFQEGNLIGVKAIQDSGLVMQKAWSTTGDDRVSEGCKANAKAGWIDLDALFPSGDLRPLRFPGDRCVLLFRRKPTKKDTK